MLKLTLPVYSDVATRKLEITFVGHVVLLLHSLVWNTKARAELWH